VDAGVSKKIDDVDADGNANHAKNDEQRYNMI
jgi:hypothetical protein